MIFDTHTHYDDEAFDADREELLSGFAASGNYKFVNIGASMEGSRASIALSKQHDFIYASVGLHPDYAADLTEENTEELIRLSKEEKCVAIGEIGLDYYYEEPGREIQQKAFAAQLDLACKLQMPVVIHSRDAAKDTYDLVKASGIERYGGIMHCLSYPPEGAKQFLDLGFYIGIGGAVTFKNARKLPDVVAMCPMDCIVIETDCPYMAPVPFRGKRNDSSYLTYVCSRIAEIKNLSAAEVERITEANARAVYGISK